MSPCRGTATAWTASCTSTIFRSGPACPYPVARSRRWSIGLSACRSSTDTPSSVNSLCGASPRMVHKVPEKLRDTSTACACLEDLPCRMSDRRPERGAPEGREASGAAARPEAPKGRSRNTRKGNCVACVPERSVRHAPRRRCFEAQVIGGEATPQQMKELTKGPPGFWRRK